MGSLIKIFSENIKMEDMFLDFNLEAERADYPGTTYSFTGADSIKIGPYRDGIAFGITNIDIDTSLNMQPQIEITFKDLYGNLVFRSGSNSDYSKIFELPPAKFTLTFKGYLGKPIRYRLQLRSTSVNYVTSDGSYEIKAKFVPNIYGFFGDIPYKFLYAVDKLKSGRGTPPNSSSILNIVKNGDIVNQKVETASQQFDKIKNKLNILLGGLGDGETLYNEINAGTFSNNGTPRQVDNIVGDNDLSSAGFTNITFNLNNKKSEGVYFSAPTGLTSTYGFAVVRSIATSGTDGTRGVDGFADGTWVSKTNALSGKTGDITALIQANLAKIQEATNRQAGTQLSQEVLDSQTIGSVMGSLAGEAAYILGYIIEGAELGYAASPGREKNEDLIGLYYPLTYQSNTTDGVNGETLYEQIPDPNATIEMQYVQNFMKAQYEGTQQIAKYKEEQEAKQNGTDGAIQQGAEIKKRLTNAEAFKANPYANQNDADLICATMLQRSGLINTRMAGPLVGESGSSNDRNDSLAKSEYENIKIGAFGLRGAQLETLRTFAKRVTDFFDSNGNKVKDWGNLVDTGGTVTYQTYFQHFFENMKRGGLNDDMFLNKDPKTLVCNYFIVNDVMYRNESELNSVFGGKDVWVYVPSSKATLTSNVNSTGSTEVTDTLTGDSSDPTTPYGNKEFFGFKKIADFPGGLGDVGNPTLMINYDKLVGGTTNSVNEMTIKIAKTAGTGIIAPSDGDLIAPLAQLSKTNAPKTFVLGMTSAPMMKTLRTWCVSLLAELPANDAVADQRKAEEEKKAAQGSGSEGTSTETSAYEPYSFDATLYNAIYHQFHHIASAWMSIIQDSLPGQDALGLANSKKLAETMEEAYRNDKYSTSLPYNMTFTMAVQATNISNDKLKNAIINTSQLIETDTESSTFSMMSNIAQQNNFLMQSIPGGLRGDSDGLSVDDLFTPQTFSEPLGNASLCFIFQPTPESRSLNNKNNFIYDDLEGFKNSLQKLGGKIPLFEFGSPDNVVVKSIKATTDENKVTGESIAAVDDIINPSNQGKKRAFDCSMLSVMQGRSYKIGMEILGNANFLPTQRFAVTNLPIFTGLYWTSNVKHSITPNNMVTNIEAIKLKYDGGNFVAVLPVTTDNYKGTTSSFNGGNNGSGSNNSPNTENIISDGLNWDFLQRVKDEKMRNANEINAFIKKYTDGKFNTYPEWFNSKIKGQKQYCDAAVITNNWTHVWDTIIPTVWSDYGNGGINFLEFLCLNMIMYNETGGNFAPISEKVNGLDNKERPGIAYPFDAIPGKKSSYNGKYNLLAGDLFKNQKYKSKFGSLPFSDPSITNDSRWNGTDFPNDLFPTNLKQAADPSKSTYLNEADFFKFRGRGLIQTTWRSAYKKVVDYILKYSGTDKATLDFKGKFKAAPFNGDADTILTLSTNEDWDTIFRTSNEVPGKAIQIHADGANKYQYFKDLTKSREVLEKAVYYVAYRVSGDGTGAYQAKFQLRVYQQLDELSPSTKVVSTKSQVNGKKVEEAPPPAGSTPAQVTAIKTTLDKLYKPTNGAGVPGMCGVYTITAAKNYTTLLKNPSATIKEGAFIGADAKSDTNRKFLEGWGYTVSLVGTKLTKQQIKDKLRSTQWGLGDVAIYWADDRPPGWNDGKSKGAQVIYGHIQIYQGKQYNPNLFATSTPDNYAKGTDLVFVYGTKPNEEWNLYVCRAPAPPKTA